MADNKGNEFARFMAEAERQDPVGFAKARAERAELEALRKDAERYRKLRDKGAVLGLRGIFNLMPNEWDEAIDTAAPEDPVVGAA